MRHAFASLQPPKLRLDLVRSTLRQGAQSRNWSLVVFRQHISQTALGFIDHECAVDPCGDDFAQHFHLFETEFCLLSVS